MGRIVAIVGRPNVGKSTLFNRLTESREAIIHETSGVTRDRHYGKAEWNGMEFSVIDTGGYMHNSEDVFEEQIKKQVVLAIEEADIILFMTDVADGLMQADEDIADLLRRTPKPTYLVVNKVDNTKRIQETSEFYQLGFDTFFPISSANGMGTGELLDAIVSNFTDKVDEEAEEGRIPKIAIVGRPNVGKSSIINALLGEERNIVTPISGTTRDAILTRYNKFNFDFYLVDTAGLRKKNKVEEDVEFYSVMRTVKAIETSDICIMVLDASEGILAQDLSIYHLIHRNGKGVVVLVNKWDLIEKDTHTANQFTKQLIDKLAPFNDVPIVYTSAITKQRIFKALEETAAVYQNKTRKIATSKLNEYLLPIIENYPPPAHKGKYVKIKYITQLPTAVPSFVFFCNLPQYVKDPYKRFLENKIRENFDFKGVPMRIFIRQK